MGSDSFEVSAKVEEEKPSRIGYGELGFVGMLIVLIVIIIFSQVILKKIRKKKEVIELKEKIPARKIQKSEKELKALESAYRSKFISEESYRKNKEKVERKLQSLKR